MLRLKDKVDIEELEKFGFEIKTDELLKTKVAKLKSYVGDVIIYENGSREFFVSRYVHKFSSNSWVLDQVPDIFYDLIKNDMIERKRH